MIGKIKFAVCLSQAILVAIFLVGQSFGDIIPPNSHSVQRCVKIANLDSFPDIALIELITGPGVVQGGYELYAITDSQCLSKGYKLNTLRILWTYKAYLDSVGINNLDVSAILSAKRATSSSMPPVYLLSSIEPYGGYVPDDNPLVGEELFYTLYLDGNSEPALYLSQQISHYNDGTPDKIETFSLSIRDNPGLSREPDGKPVLLCSHTRIAYSVPQDGLVKIELNNITGQTVFRAARYCRKAVMNLVLLPQLPAGTYVACLESGDYRTKKSFLIVP